MATCVCVFACLHWVCDRVQWSKSRNSPRSQGKAQMCRGAFLLAETLFSNIQEPKISQCWGDGFNRERSGGFPRVAADPNAHFIITQADTDVYLHRVGMAEEFGAMLPRRSEAWFIEWKSHKQTTEQVPGSSHSRTRAHTDAHRHPHLYAPECCRNTLSQVWSLFAVASRIKRVKRDAR